MNPTYKNKERKQERLTYQDTINSQEELLTLLGWKIRKNVGLSDKEAKEFPKLLGDALLSQGNKHRLYYEHGNRKIPLGCVHTFSLKMKSIQGPQQNLNYEDLNIIVPISDLWQLLYDSYLNIFPSAIEESIHISKEIPHREKDEGFEFSVEKDLS